MWRHVPVIPAILWQEGQETHQAALESIPPLPLRSACQMQELQVCMTRCSGYQLDCRPLALYTETEQVRSPTGEGSPAHGNSETQKLT